MSDDSSWYVMVSGTREGPTTADELGRRLDKGEIGLATVAYGPGFTDWKPIGDIPEIADWEPPAEPTATVTSADAAVAAQSTPPSAAPPTANLPSRPARPPTMDGAPAFSPQATPVPAGGRGARPQASGGGAAAAMEPVREGAEVAGSTLQLTVRPASEYSRLNFVLRLLGFYYMLYVAHAAMWTGYRIAAAVASSLNLILALITGRHHRGLVNYLQRFLRFEARMGMSVMGLTEEIPHIDVNLRRPDFPVDVTTQPGMEIGAGAVIVRLSGIVGILLIPHFLALGLLGIGAFFAFIAGFFAVIFTGAWPDGIFNFLVGILRWNLRVVEYVFGLSTQYPPFGLN